MQQINIRSRSPRAEVVRTLRGLPDAAVARGRDQLQLVAVLRSAFVHSLLTRIHDAFLQKSRGEADELGDKWAPLSPATVRRRLKRHPVSASLSPSERRRWGGFYASAYRQLHGMSPRDRDRKASSIAWLQFRLPINIDTGRLEKSLRPGVLAGPEYRPPHEQQVEQRGPVVSIRTLVPYAPYVHRRRRLYPAVAKMKPWIKDSLTDARDAVIAYLRDIL